MVNLILTLLMILVLPIILFLIGLILVQESKSGGLSGAFGGGGANTLLGAKAGRELSRMTSYGTVFLGVILIMIGILCNLQSKESATDSPKDPTAEEKSLTEMPDKDIEAGTGTDATSDGSAPEGAAPEASGENPAGEGAGGTPAPASESESTPEGEGGASPPAETPEPAAADDESTEENKTPETPVSSEEQ